MNLTISPIPYGLRRNEVLFEIVNSLQKLEDIIEVVFQSIDQRVGSFGSTLLEINVRTSNCVTKLNQLKTWGTRATKVFSSHKYPRTELFDKIVFRSVYSEIDDKLQRKHSYQSSDNDFNNNSQRFGQMIPFDEQIIDEKIKFFKLNFSFKVKSEKTNPLFKRIGSIRWHRIHSLSSLLIFNTSEVAFVSRSQKSSDSKQNQSKDVVDSRKRLDSAPKSMTTPVEEINELHFIGSGAAPQLMEALPMALPSLPGIADEFVSDSHSVLQMESTTENQTLLPNFLPVLPNFNQLMNSTNLLDNSTQLPDLKTKDSKTLLPSPPPPPPPPPPLPIFIESDVDGQSKSKMVPPSSSPPPPPPPPPPLLSLISKIPPPPIGPSPTSPAIALSPGIPKDKPIMTSSLSIDNSRASLLESIRMAGGKPKTKTIKEKKIDKKLQQKEKQELGTSKASSGGGGDLMSDLMSRLALRRDGISGNQKAVPNKNSSKFERNVSAMDRISAMIPPPPVNDSGNELSDPEDDWND